MKKKLIILLLLVILCIGVLQGISGKLEKMHDILLYEYSGELKSGVLQSIHNYNKANKYIVDTGVYMTQNALLGTNTKNALNITIYQVDGRFPSFLPIRMIHGRFIRDMDIMQNKKYIVIDNHTAMSLFATSNCIGKSILLGDNKYVVIGVYSPASSPLNTISAVHSRAAYIPLMLPTPKESKSVIMVKVKEKTSAILNNSLLSDMESLLNARLSSENIDIKSRRAQQKIHLTYIGLTLISLCLIVRIVYHRLKNLYKSIKADTASYYPSQLFKQYRRSTTFSILFLLVSFIGVCMLFQSIKLDYLLDASLVPSKLIDLKEIQNKLSEYYINNNNRAPILSTFHSMTEHTDHMTNYIIIILVPLFWSLVRTSSSNLRKLDPSYYSKASSRNDKTLDIT